MTLFKVVMEIAVPSTEDISEGELISELTDDLVLIHSEDGWTLPKIEAQVWDADYEPKREA